ncbi:MAG: DUF3256 family protein [Prevotella sp.]|nr:DUF3256 family protein [Prevotella sp.]
MKKYLILLPFMLFSMSLSAQTSMREVWLSMPDSMIPYMNKSQRLEHVELLEMQVDSKVKNLLSGEGQMDTISDRFLQIRLNASADLQLLLLPKPDSSQVVCMVKTVRAQHAESEIRFYTTSWERIDDMFGLPSPADGESIIGSFFTENDTLPAARMHELQRGIDPVMMSAMLFPDSPELILELSSSLKTAKEASEVKAYLRQRKFKWDGLSFKEC